jgi:DNA gyrase subunit B
VLRSAKLLRVAEDDIVKDDALEGLTAVVTVRLAEPQFEGQTKEVLGTPAASRIVAQVVGTRLRDFLTSSKRAEKAQSRALLEKVVSAARTRVAARAHKEAQRRKNALETSSLPAKLADAAHDVERSKLIVEGDSALAPQLAELSSGAQRSAARSQRQVVGRRQSATPSARIIQVTAPAPAVVRLDAVGMGRSSSWTRTSTARTFAACCGPVAPVYAPLVEGAGCCRCRIARIGRAWASRTSSSTPYRYLYRGRPDPPRKEVRADQRYKGLGEMDAALAETTMDPRTTLPDQLGDVEDAERIFGLLMGNDIAGKVPYSQRGRPVSIDASAGTARHVVDWLDLAPRTGRRDDRDRIHGSPSVNTAPIGHPGVPVPRTVIMRQNSDQLQAPFIFLLFDTHFVVDTGATESADFPIRRVGR